MRSRVPAQLYCALAEHERGYQDTVILSGYVVLICVFLLQIHAHNTVLFWIMFDQKKKKRKKMALSGRAESKLTLKCD